MPPVAAYAALVRAAAKALELQHVFVSTYQEIAMDIGNEKAHRAVATVMRKNHKYCALAYERGEISRDQVVPCHRVVSASGAHVGYIVEAGAGASASRRRRRRGRCCRSRPTTTGSYTNLRTSTPTCEGWRCKRKRSLDVWSHTPPTVVATSRGRPR